MHPCAQPESQNYANDQIFLCIDEKDFYVNGGAVLCIISGVSCDAGLAGRVGQGIKFASQFSFQSDVKTENFPATPPPASFSMLSYLTYTQLSSQEQMHGSEVDGDRISYLAWFDSEH